MSEHGTENCANLKVELHFAPIRLLVTIIVVGPIVVLLCCFVTAKVFQIEETYDLHYCNHPNFIPSISTIIGIVPQVYFWRVCMALVVAPKLFLGELYKAYFLCLADTLKSKEIKKLTQWLLYMCFWCNVVDTVALCGLSFISNREDFVIHEKCFIVFMTSSFLSMVLVMATFFAFKEYLPRAMLVSLRIKVILFCLATILGMIMLYFYHLYVNWCVENTFSWFALCEYGMTFCILCFHWTIVLDFPDKRIKLEIVDA